MFIVMRMLNGGASASVQAVGAGTIADIWEVKERGRAMGIFYLGPLLGPLLSPIIGGALNGGWGWRSTQWFCVIYGGIIWLGILLGLPETLKNRKPVTERIDPQGSREAGAEVNAVTRTSTRQSIQIKTTKWLKFLHRAFVEPLKIILTLRFGAVALTVWYASTTFFCLYFLNLSVQQVFEAPPYEYSSIIIGCLYIPNSLGYIVASIFGGRWVDYIMRKRAEKANRRDEKGRLVFRPEDRVGKNAWLAAVIFPASMVWYAWTAQYGVIWIVPVSTVSPSPHFHVC
jgi:MFS family permease